MVLFMFVHLLWSDFTFEYDNMLFILYPAGKIHKFSVPFREVVDAYANLELIHSKAVQYHYF